MKRRKAGAPARDLRRRNTDVLFRAALKHHEERRIDKAVLGYQQVLRLAPDHVPSLINLGNAHQGRGALDEAAKYYRRALEIKPDTPEAHFNLGNIFKNTGRFEDAVEAYRRALKLRPTYSGAQFNLGHVLRATGHDRDALAAYRRTLELDPNHLGACHALFKFAIGSCNFSEIEAIIERIARAIPSYVPKSQEFQILGNVAYDNMFYPLPPRLYRMLTDRIGDILTRGFRPLPERPRPSDPDRRLRVGYISPNFGDHPVGHVTRSLFASHDHEAFEFFGYATRDRSEEPADFHRTIRAGFDRFTDISRMGPVKAARLIADDDIDVLVDLDGYMDITSPPIMAQRPSRIQVYWLGHAGGLGLPFIDYLFADRTVLPPAEDDRYSEAVVRLPEVYHPTDRAPIALEMPSREEQGLSENAIVFCAFNNPEKIDRRVFESWMRIMGALPGSELWISDRRKYADPRPVLRAAAKAHGIDPERIVFARHAPDKAAHLARHGLADLFLDTVTLNAATTALDALWVGLPVLTCGGDTFPSRMAASFLHAIGMPDMICPTLRDYEKRAVELARNPPALAELKSRLAVNRDREPLFNVSRLARHLEDAYREMWRRYLAGEPVAGFDVPARERASHAP